MSKAVRDGWIAPARGAAALGLAAGISGLGLLSLLHHDFTLQWEPVPAGWPHRPLLALASGLMLLAAGAMTALPRTRACGGLLAFGFIGLWALGLQAPRALAAPADVSRWLSVAECAAMAMGGLMLWSETGGGKAVAPAAGLAVRLFGLAAIVFGASHVAYAHFTASMVPDWLPARLALAYATGAVHAATGLALLLRRWVRPAAALEAAMMSSFVLLVHVPRVAAAPSSRTEQTLLLVALTLAASAWIVASARRI
ncbi:hypothetical protein ACO2Q3_20490 [Caulobacter sp. KR2-114]|uniref:hypothetical protein n=1 Tax=Caulobacter sp. KR2-114 TaxID=3400912 RepID=UPI003BFDDC5F